jgi:hypothetical protein
MKNGNLSIVFSVQGTGGSPTGPDPENRVGDQDNGSPGSPVSSGLQVHGEPWRCRAKDLAAPLFFFFLCLTALFLYHSVTFPVRLI